MIVLAIDPGSALSAFVLYDTDIGMPCGFGKVANLDLLGRVAGRGSFNSLLGASPDHLAIEMIASYGMPVGAEVFDTCVWIGRFVEAWRKPHTRVYRKDVKLHLCGQPRAKDSNIRQALIDRYGGKDAAIGRKNARGPLHGMSADVWAALAVAVTYADRPAGAAA